MKVININILDIIIFKKYFKKHVPFSINSRPLFIPANRICDYRGGSKFISNNTNKYKHKYNVFCCIDDRDGDYFIDLLSIKKNTFEVCCSKGITELIYFIAFNTLHIANKLKRERIKIKEHFRLHIKEIIECLPGGVLYQECESRFNQLQDELNI